MFWYLLIFVLVLLLWLLIKWVIEVRAHLEVLKTVPLHEEMPSMFSTQLFKKIKNSSQFFRIVSGWIYRTGVQMFAYWVFTMPFPHYVVVKPRLFKEVTKLPITVRKGRITENFRQWLGDGLLLSYGEKWERNRRLLTPAFHFDILKSYATVFNREADILQEIITELTGDGRSVNVEPLVKSATLDTILRCALSYGEEGEVQRLGQSHPYLVAVHRLNQLASNRMTNPVYAFSDWIWFLTADGKEFLKNCDYVHDFAAKIITSRRKALESGSGGSEVKKRRLDFLDILLQARDSDGKGLSDEEIRCEADTFMFAGHDTTGSALMWALHCVAKYPEEQARVYEEIRDTVGDRPDVEWNDLGELKYLTYFIKEVLRTHPPATAISRMLTEEATLDGVKFPKGTHIGGYIYTLHRHPDVWDEPEEFRPSRFLPENQKDADPYAFLPFSAGSRNCIGQVFAMNEIKIFLAKLVKRFEISVDPDREAIPYIEVTMSSENGIYLYFKDRQTPRSETTV